MRELGRVFVRAASPVSRSPARTFNGRSERPVQDEKLHRDRERCRDGGHLATGRARQALPDLSSPSSAPTRITCRSPTSTPFVEVERRSRPTRGRFAGFSAATGRSFWSKAAGRRATAANAKDSEAKFRCASSVPNSSRGADSRPGHPAERWHGDVAAWRHPGGRRQPWRAPAPSRRTPALRWIRAGRARGRTAAGRRTDGDLYAPIAARRATISWNSIWSANVSDGSR